METTSSADGCFLKVACCKRRHTYRLSELIRFEALSNYTIIHAVNRCPLVVAKVLSAYENVLKDIGFIRVHRSHLVNQDFIKYVDPTGNITLTDNSRIEISRRKKKQIITVLKHNGLNGGNKLA